VKGKAGRQTTQQSGLAAIKRNALLRVEPESCTTARILGGSWASARGVGGRAVAVASRLSRIWSLKAPVATGSLESDGPHDTVAQRLTSRVTASVHQVRFWCSRYDQNQPNSDDDSRELSAKRQASPAASHPSGECVLPALSLGKSEYNTHLVSTPSVSKPGPALSRPYRTRTVPGSAPPQH
jgi:hypothetical protein